MSQNCEYDFNDFQLSRFLQVDNVLYLMIQSLVLDLATSLGMMFHYMGLINICRSILNKIALRKFLDDLVLL